MSSMNGSFSPGSQRYTDIKLHSSPVGQFKECLHIQARELRGLKVMRADLTEKAVFLGWYVAALTLAGDAAELLRLPTLVAPLRAPDGKLFSIIDGDYVIERPFFGSDDDPAWNLNEFVDEFASGGRGVNETVALAVMSLVADTLKIMHNAKLRTKGIQRAGIAHLNLKPQNIIIGRDPRTQEYQVRLTDFLIAMASPLAEQNGVTAPLNYSYPGVLKDSAYYGLEADIFSCGLLLYRLVENKDLIPSGLDRKGVLDFMRDKLPETLKTLKLTDAGGRTRDIIQRCLTENEGERFETIGLLKEEADGALKGKEPANEIGSCVDGGLRPLPLPDYVEEEEEDGPSPWWKRILKGATIAVAAAILLFAGLKIVKWIELRELKDKMETAGKLLAELRASRCASLSTDTEVTHSISSAESLMNADSIEAASQVLDRIEARLSSINEYCNKYQPVKERSEKMSDGLSGLSTCEAYIDTALNRINAEKYSAADDYLDRADKCLVALTYRPPFECSTEEKRQMRKILSGIGGTCRGWAQKQFDNAMRACEERDQASFEKYKQVLKSLADEAQCWECGSSMNALFTIRDNLEPDCRGKGQGIVDRAKDACEQDDKRTFYAERQTLINLSRESGCMPVDRCEEERQLVGRARTLMAEFRRIFGELGVAYDSIEEYTRGLDNLQRAEDHLANNDCDQANFRATSAVSDFAKAGPCDDLSRDVRRIRDDFQKHREEMSQWETNLHSLNKYLNQCSCDEARAEVSRIPPYQAPCSDLDYRVETAREKHELLPDLGSSEQARMQAIDSLMDRRECDQADELIIAVERAIYDWENNNPITFEDCDSRFRASSWSEACKICEKVDPTDAQYSLAMKYFIVAVGKKMRYHKDLRPKLEKAFDAIDGKKEPTDLMASVYITMICAYGWDLSSMNIRKALEYYEMANGLGVVFGDQRDYWMAMLVVTRCHFRNWQELRSQPNFNSASDNILLLQDILDERENPVSAQFMLEINGYQDELLGDN